MTSGKDTGVNIESKSGTELPSWGSGSYSCSGLLEKDNLPKYKHGSQNFIIGQVQMGVLKLNLGFQNNMITGLEISGLVKG